MLKLDRRSSLIAGVLAASALMLGACNGGGGGAGGGGAAAEGDMTMGSAEAPVTVVEYASVTCAHCAAWNEQVFPEFKSRFIDTGQVRYVFRELPTPPANIAVAGFLAARCAGEDRYFAMIDAMMRNQQAMIADPRGELLRIARTAGMTEEQFDACVTDQEAADALEERVQQANEQGVTGTPYFLVNGEHLDGPPTIEAFEAAIRAAGGNVPAAADGEAAATAED